ncbi:MAG: type III pantothenate kinase [Phycisphaerae bacterium]
MAREIEQVDSLLVIDVGNSRIGMSVWNRDGMNDTRRISALDEDAWPTAIREMWDLTRPKDRRAIVMGSVSPRVAGVFAEIVDEVCDCPPARVRDHVPLPMELDIEGVEEVGVDRVCSAAAAYAQVQGACAIASFGTAITIDCVNADGRFLGGTILPGLQMSLDALHEDTAALPQILMSAASATSTLPGKSTQSAMLGGVLYGAVGALREIVEQYANELKSWPTLIVTGGNAALLRERIDFADAWVPDLCLMGVALAYRRAAGMV